MCRSVSAALSCSLALVFAVAGCAPGESPATRTEPSLSSPVLLLGSAASFSVLGAETVTNTGATTISLDLGLFPGTAVTGAPLVLGAAHISDDTARLAQLAVTNAYNELAGRPCDATFSNPDLVGLTLAPGVYCFPEGAQLSGALTLDANGDADAEFVFLIGSTLTAASGASVLLLDGADPCNVFWQVGSSATIGTDAEFTGNILALASVALQTRATLRGRALATTGAVTLDTNLIATTECQDTVGGEGEGEGEDCPDAGIVDDICAEGLTMCVDACVDLNNDVANCGTCGNVCAGSEGCHGGTCMDCPTDG